jgi:opine dehydrogenase
VTILLNPGSTGGALEFRRVFAEHGVGARPILVETGTLSHCARADGERGVNVGLRVRHIACAALPALATEEVVAGLQRHFPGLRPRADVLEVALCNGNPVIHPAIMLSNLAAIERSGGEHRFYADGVTPGVARIIEAVDCERLAIGAALGYELMTEPEMCVAQGYGRSTNYYECYASSEVFGALLSPTGTDHRYLHEDVGLGLVTYVSLGDMLGVPCPRSRALVELASAVTGRGYLREGRRSAERLGLAGLSAEERGRLLRGE